MNAPDVHPLNAKARQFAAELRGCCVYLATCLPFAAVRLAVLRCVLRGIGAGASFGHGIRVLKPSNVEVGHRVIVNSGAILDGRGGRLSIGDDSDIGRDVFIWTLEHDPSSPGHGVRGNAVIIGRRVWIAPRVTILPGIHIADNSIVATGAVVTRDVPKGAIVAGVPARVIGKRTVADSYRQEYRLLL